MKVCEKADGLAFLRAQRGRAGKSARLNVRPDGEVHLHKSQILHCQEKLLSMRSSARTVNRHRWTE